MIYDEQVLDPWFSVTDCSGHWEDCDSKKRESVLGCAMQWNICNPTLSRCTPPYGHLGMFSNLDSLSLSPAQNVTAQRLLKFIELGDPGFQVKYLGSDALWAKNLFISDYGLGFSPPLPQNQWQKEALGWYLTSLVVIQAGMIEYASKGLEFAD